MTTNLEPFSIVPEDLLRAVSSTAIVLWCALHRFADRLGECYPSVATLTQRTSLSRRTIQRALIELQKSGRLIVKRRKRSEQLNDSNAYVLLFHKLGGSVVGDATPSVMGDAGVASPVTHKREPLNEKKNKDSDQLVEIPDSLCTGPTSGFRSTWQSWLEYRRQLRKPLTAATQRAQLAKCSQAGASRAIEAIETSIANGWQGLFFEKTATKTPAKVSSLFTDDGDAASYFKTQGKK